MKARYIRQSTASQSNLRQLAKAHADETLFIDVISGSVPFKERPEGKKLIEAVENGLIDYVSFHAIDRAGRNTMDVISTLEYLHNKGVTVKIENLGLESTINDKKNPIFSLVTTILSEISAMEKTNLLERQAEGIQQAKLKGTYKGRVVGSVESKEVVLEKYKAVVKVLNQYPTMSLRQIAELCNSKINKGEKKLSPNTVRKVKELLTAQVA